jgi:hypothetical protein
MWTEVVGQTAEFRGPCQPHLPKTAKFLPRRVTWLTFDHENGMNSPEAGEKRVLIAKYLPQTKPQLVFFVGYSQALHLSNEARFSLCPSKVEERIIWARSERLDAVGIQKTDQSIQRSGMAPWGAPDLPDCGSL